MKITSINYQNTFKGLWGETIKTNERKNVGTKELFANYETKIYYPFGDESIEAVNNVLKENTTYKKFTTNNIDKLSIYETGTDVSVKNPLLFSGKQWLKYLSNKLAIGSIEHRLIEENLKRLHLEKYIKI